MSRRRAAALTAGVLALSGLSALAVSAATSGEGFQARMTEAMERMHHGMMTAPTGDPDRDFSTMMIPHHQGAIDMAQVELTYGKDERLRRLSQAIIVEQNQEIAVMRLILKERAATSPASKAHEGRGQ